MRSVYAACRQACPRKAERGKEGGISVKNRPKTSLFSPAGQTKKTHQAHFPVFSSMRKGLIPPDPPGITAGISLSQLQHPPDVIHMLLTLVDI